MKSFRFRESVWGCLGLWVAVTAAEPRGGRDKNRANQPTQNSTSLSVPAHPFDVVLGRPTRDSVTVSVLAYQNAEGCIA